MQRPGTFLVSLLLVTLATASHAAVVTEKLNYKHGDVELKGFVCYDDAKKGKRPGVLLVHEWWGLNDHAREKAKQLAKEGYVVLAVDMYGEGKTTDHPEEAGEWSNAVGENEAFLEARFRAGYQRLQAHELTARGKIAAIGYCFGGGVVLRMAKAGTDLRGVVSFHGSLPTAAVEAGTIKAKILVCHGADDPFMDDDQVHKFQRVLAKAGADWQFISYGGAKHSFTVKEAAARGIPALEYNEAADKRSWAAMLRFFDEIFGQR